MSSAEGALDYVSDSTFLRFFIIIFVIIGLTTYRDDTPLRNPENLVTALSLSFIACGLWLTVSVSFLISIFRRGYITTIYTPFIIVPLVPISEFVGHNSSLLLFGSGYLVDVSYITMVVKTILVVICFDILHGRYVAPLHRTFIPQSNKGTLIQPIPHELEGIRKDDPVSEDRVSLLDSSIDLIGEKSFASDQRASVSSMNETTKQVIIGNQSFASHDIRWIQSDDHYLNIRLSSKNVLVRAKLIDAAGVLDHKHGMQINRSTWVAYASILNKVDLDQAQIELFLGEGHSVTVPKMRKLVFVQNYTLYIERSREN